MTKKGFFKKLQIVLATVLIFTNVPPMEASAATAKEQTATLRIISTTDLHGQVSTTHYDSASEKNNSLAKVYTLIQNARKEVGTDNTMTVDIGDSVYGYAADTILEKMGEETVQPIYAAMAKVGYDAITLGNHDFDYGYRYIDDQLYLSGLRNKCVVSNVLTASTGDTTWKENMIITKTLKTSNKKKVKVKIGIIGVTVPSLSSYYNSKGDLATLPIVDTVKKQTAKLKKQGVNFVVVLAHTSFGIEEPSANADNALYALSKVAGVDAIVGGHGHKNYPSTDADIENVYRMPGVDKKTGLMNGKPVTMVKDHAAGIGVIDLKLKVAGNKVTLADSKAQVRGVKKSTASAQKILNAENKTADIVEESLNEIVANLNDNTEIDNYFALLEDNYAIQLVNEAKIRYGLAYTGGLGKKVYGNDPVIAVSQYNLYGNNSAIDNICLTGNIKKKDILKMQQDNHESNMLYWITGRQLREWLEWSASIYATKDEKITSDKILSKYMEQYQAGSVVSEGWLNDWSGFSVFDGIEYTIDATKKPRYNQNGSLKNASTHRIVSLTCNGVPIDDTQRFVLVSSSVNDSHYANAGISAQKIQGRSQFSYQILEDYIREQSEMGTLKDTTDYNWKVLFDENKQYVMRSSSLSTVGVKAKEWYWTTLKKSSNFAYYTAQFSNGESEGNPLLVLSPTVTGITNEAIDIKVQANSRYGIEKLVWLVDKEEAEGTRWNFANTINNGSFSVKKNGIYSVLAVDKAGNKIVKYIDIENYNSSVVLAPTVNKLSNRSSILSGTAGYGTTVHIMAGTKQYDAETTKDGTYSCTVERMKAGTPVSVFCTDKMGNRSDTVSIEVYRLGPDPVIVDKVSNKLEKVTGRFTDSASGLVAITGNTVYVGGPTSKTLYKKSSLYSESMNIKMVTFVQSGQEFEFYLPPQNAGKALRFLALDKAGRASANVKMKTANEGPNLPKIYDVCDAEEYIYGKVTNVEKQGMVTVSIGDVSYAGAVASNGTFAIKTNGMHEGESIRVAASDSSQGKMRTSLVATAKVKGMQNYHNGKIRLSDIYDTSTEFNGKVSEGNKLYMVVNGVTKELKLDANGRFYHTLDTPYVIGQKLYFIARTNSGKITSTLGYKVTAEPLSIPDAPTILEKDEIDGDTEYFEALSDEIGAISVNINGTETIYNNGDYNSEYNAYLYGINIPSAMTEEVLTICFISDEGVYSEPVVIERKPV